MTSNITYTKVLITQSKKYVYRFDRFQVLMYIKITLSENIIVTNIGQCPLVSALGKLHSNNCFVFILHSCIQIVEIWISYHNRELIMILVYQKRELQSK